MEISAETAAFLGMSISSRPTVDEALIAAVLTAGNACRVNVTVMVGGKAAKAGLQVNGIKTLTGGVCYTDAAGKVMGLSSQSTTTISTIAYVDISAVSKSVSTPSQGTANVTLDVQVPANNVIRKYRASAGVMFSPYIVNADIFCVGGGGGGASGGGGGGGYTATAFNVVPPKLTLLTLIVGPGGGGGAWNSPVGGPGGDSSFCGVTAPGGRGGNASSLCTGGDGGSGGGGGGDGIPGPGGKGGANGAYGQSGGYSGGRGQGGNTRAFREAGGELFSGGGGGQGINTGTIALGGEGGGGNGGADGTEPTSGTNGLGGGGGASQRTTSSSGAQGGSGIVLVRCRVAA